MDKSSGSFKYLVTLSDGQEGVYVAQRLAIDQDVAAKPNKSAPQHKRRKGSVALDAGADSDDSDGIEGGSHDSEEESADDAMDIDSEGEGGEADDEKRAGNRAGGRQLEHEAKDEKKGGERKEAKANCR